jgi:hypothetical protein
MAQVLGVADRTTMAAVLDEIPGRVGGIVNEVRHDGTGIRFGLDHHLTGQQQVALGGPAFRHLGGFVLAEAAVTPALIQAEEEPTVLIFDDFLNMLHPRLQAAITALLQSKIDGFQAVMVTHSPAVLAGSDANWLLTEFTESPDGFRISQDRTAEAKLKELEDDFQALHVHTMRP